MKKLLSIITFTTLFCSFNTFAGTLTTIPKATATLASTCSIAGTNVDLGEISGTVSQSNYASGVGAINVKCSNNVAYSIGLNFGLLASDNGRSLKGNTKGDVIGYYICKSPGFTNFNCSTTAAYWYDWSGQQYRVTSTGTGNSQSFPTYVYIPKQFATPDTYSDTTTATIYY